MSYHGSMKKMSFLLVSLFLLTSCNQQTYSFKEVAGFETSDITQMQVSSGVYQSFAWVVDEKYYSYLDCSYVLVNFDIDEEFLNAWPPSEAKDDAICIRISAENFYPYDMWYSGLFYISHKSHYMYTYSSEEGKCFRSKYVMPNSFIIGITWN